MRYMSGLFCGLLLLMCVGQSPLHSLQGFEKPGAPPPENRVRYFAGVGTEASGGNNMNILLPLPLPNIFGQAGIALDFVPRIFGFDLFADAGLGLLIGGDADVSFNGGAQADFRFFDTLSLGVGGGVTYMGSVSPYIRFSCSVLIWRHFARGCKCNQAVRVGVYYDILTASDHSQRFGLKVSYAWFY